MAKEAQIRTYIQLCCTFELASYTVQGPHYAALRRISMAYCRDYLPRIRANAHFRSNSRSRTSTADRRAGATVGPSDPATAPPAGPASAAATQKAPLPMPPKPPATLTLAMRATGKPPQPMANRPLLPPAPAAPPARTTTRSDSEAGIPPGPRRPRPPRRTAPSRPHRRRRAARIRPPPRPRRHQRGPPPAAAGRPLQTPSHQSTGSNRPAGRRRPTNRQARTAPSTRTAWPAPPPARHLMQPRRRPCPGIGRPIPWTGRAARARRSQGIWRVRSGGTPAGARCRVPLPQPPHRTTNPAAAAAAAFSPPQPE